MRFKPTTVVLAVILAVAIAVSSLTMVGATVYDLSKGSTTPTRWPGYIVPLTNTIDFSLHPITGSDTVTIFRVPAGTIIFGVTARIDVATTPTTTIDVGDADSASLWLSNKSVGTAGVLFTNVAATTDSLTTLYAKNYTALGALTLHPDGSIPNGKITFSAFGFQP